MACQMAYRMAYQMAILTIMWVGLITLLCTMVDTDLDPCSHSPEVTTPMIIHMVAFLQTQLITGRLPLLPQYVLLVQDIAVFKVFNFEMCMCFAVLSSIKDDLLNKRSED